jgi:magnesium transporter
MAGNVEIQSLAVIIRVLMDEDLSAGDKATSVEMRVGFSNGLILGVYSTFHLSSPCRMSGAKQA